MSGPKLEVGGFRVQFLTENDAVYKEVKRTGKLFDTDILGEIMKHAKNSMSSVIGRTVMIDVGAHFGCVTLPASKVFDRVYSIEACDKNYRMLTINLAENMATNVVPMNFAAGDVDGRCVQLDPSRPRADNSGSMYFVPASTGVEVKRLDTAIPEQDWQFVRFVKIDVEEMEYDVLRGAIGILTKSRADVFAEEIRGDHPEKRRHDEKNIQQLMSSLGYAKSRQMCGGWIWRQK